MDFHTLIIKAQCLWQHFMTQNFITQSSLELPLEPVQGKGVQGRVKGFFTPQHTNKDIKPPSQ